MKNREEIVNKNILLEKIETDSEDSYYEIKKSICSTPTRYNRIQELNEGEILQRIDALNLHYDQRENETLSEISDIDSFKNINTKVDFSLKAINNLSNELQLNEDSEQEYFQRENRLEEEDESININKLLLNSIKKKIDSKTQIEDIVEKMEKVEHKINKNEVEARNNGNYIKQPDHLQQQRVESQKNIGSFGYHKISEFEVINQDHSLKPFEGKIRERLDIMNRLIKDIENNEISLLEFSRGYNKLGMNVTDKEIIFREYAPGAKSISLVN